MRRMPEPFRPWTRVLALALLAPGAIGGLELRSTEETAQVRLVSGPHQVAAQLCAERAERDAFGIYSGGHALWLPGIGTDFVFALGPGSLVVADGAASLRGVLYRASKPEEGFSISARLSGYRPPAAGRQASPSPHKELLSAAYADRGGPVDPTTWGYFTRLEGRLEGMGAFAGSLLEIELLERPFQLGAGANGKNVAFGASGTLGWKVLRQPAGAYLQATGQGEVYLDLQACGAGTPPPPAARAEEAHPAAAIEPLDPHVSPGGDGSGRPAPRERLQDPLEALAAFDCASL